MTGRAVRLSNEVLWRKDGSFFTAEYSAWPLIEGGELAGSVVTENESKWWAMSGAVASAAAIVRKGRASLPSPSSLAPTPRHGPTATQLYEVTVPRTPPSAKPSTLTSRPSRRVSQHKATLHTVTTACLSPSDSPETHPSLLRCGTSCSERSTLKFKPHRAQFRAAIRHAR